MVTISSEARSRIRKVGRTTQLIRQRGIPFDVPFFVPIVNPFVDKQVLFRVQYRLTGVSLEDVRQGVMFADYRSFLDIRMERFSRRARTRHFAENPFTRKFEENLGGLFGQPGVRMGRAAAAFLVRHLGLVEWKMSEDATTSPDTASIHAHVSARFFDGHFTIRIQREPDGVVLTDDWLPEGGGNVRTPSFPMAALMLVTHPMGIEQIAERVVEEIVQARHAGHPYAGQIGPPSEEID
jgi:hypothetical protein